MNRAISVTPTEIPAAGPGSSCGASRRLDVVAPRSPVPDLLFEDVREQRVEDLLPFAEDPFLVDSAVAIHRVTVFLTYRCNLECPYCKTIVRTPADLSARPQRGESYDLESFRTMLAAHGETPIEHLHFTGGEASLVRDLPEMVRFAKARGVLRTSITSNGTRSPDTYLRLVEAGIDEIRISVDAADAAQGQRHTRRAGAWSKSIETVRALGAARREGRPFFLILNTVVTKENRAELDAIVAFLLDLGPDDVKLITEVDAKGELASFAERDRVVRAIERRLEAAPRDRYPLLRMKLSTVFAPDAIGLDGEAAPAGKAWRCYVPLTERTVDGVYYYPCSVWLREGGPPLGRVDEDHSVQRRKLAAFTARGDCLADAICSRYCLHCTRAFNARVNEERR